MRCILFIFAIMVLFGINSVSQMTQNPDKTNGKISFATNVYMSKGGFGIIDQNTSVYLKAARNELVLSSGERWTGQSAAVPEVVALFKNRVWRMEDIPGVFDLSKAVIISFETDKVRFFDFRRMEGGFYWRPGHAVP